MNPVDQALPGFAQSCVVLYVLLLPWGLALLVMAFAFEFWHGPLHPVELLKCIVKLFLIVLLMAKSHDLINGGQDLVQAFVKNNIPASPEKVAERYKQKLAEAQNAPELKDQSFLSQLFSSDWFEAIIFAFLTLLSWLAMALVFFVYCVQRAALLLCWAMSPLLFPLLAIRPLSNVGMRHLLRMIAIMLWPIGIALAATITSGLIDVAADKDFLSGYSAAGALGRGLISMLAVSVITIWIIFSTIAAPVFIQRLIAGGDGPTTALTKSADLMASIAVPSYFGVPNATRGARYAGGAIMRAAENLWRWAGSSKTGGTETAATVLNPLPIPHAPQPPPSTWTPTPDDPTGDRFARNIVKQAKSK